MIFLEIDFFLKQHGHLKSRFLAQLSKPRSIIQAGERTIIHGFHLIAVIIDIFLRHSSRSWLFS